MRLSPRYLLDYRRPYHSQNGEDGVLEYILYKLPVRDHWCVEFGAWDGVHLSNTYFLLSKWNYRAVMIEGVRERYEELLTLQKKHDRMICIHRFVAFEGEDTLDNILRETPIPGDFDLLSIDIDADDYHIFRSINAYRPKVVIIEINIKDKPDIRKVNRTGSPVVHGVSGTSILSMTELAREKGYSLVANIACNAVYVRNEYYPLFHKKAYHPRDLFTFEGHARSELTLREYLRRRSEKIRIQKTRLLSPCQELLRRRWRL
jgi:hypothetical protein